MNSQFGMAASTKYSIWRLLSTVWCDIRLQFRNGFYYATAFVTVAYALLFSQLNGRGIGSGLGSDLASGLGPLFPVIVLDSMLVGTFYFVAGLVLLEKGDGTLEAQVVSPLRPVEYLASKVITLTLLTTVQYLVLIILFAGLSFGTLAFVLGVILASTMYILIGFISVARYTSISEYLVPSIPYTGFLLLPLLVYALGLGQGTTPLSYLIYLHPLEAPLRLLQVAGGPVEAWQVVYGVLYSGLWIYVLGRLSLRSLARYIVAKAGTEAGRDVRAIAN